MKWHLIPPHPLPLQLHPFTLDHCPDRRRRLLQRGHKAPDAARGDSAPAAGAAHGCKLEVRVPLGFRGRQGSLQRIRGTNQLGLTLETRPACWTVCCSTEEDKVFENALAQFWEHSDRWGTCSCAAAHAADAADAADACSRRLLESGCPL